jgi:phosphoribosylanthranilate isomerase
MTKIKICGITREEDALLCRDLGADFMGMIFVESSPRYVEPERAAAIVQSLGEARPRVVGVFRDQSSDYIRSVAAQVGLDVIQLHGHETNDDIRELDLPSVKALRVGDDLPDTKAHESADWLLFDTLDERRAGGTGRRFDWSLLAGYARDKPFFLAGGLTPDNVAVAISAARPDAIDVSSGVESAPGIKDREKLHTLFERIRRT